jgi:hypothetical protein
MRSSLARLAPIVPLVAVLAVCESDPTTTEIESEDATGVAGKQVTGASMHACPNCTFGPTLYTRGRGRPAMEVNEFDGNPSGAYTLETDDMGTRGAKVLLWLNGKLVKTPAGLHQQDVVLDWENTLEVQVVGKPGSQVHVRIFQEVASVVVTPDPKKSRIPATQQFTAVALDRNGVEIPNQTFTWESSDTTIATVDATTGLASTVGATHLSDPFTFFTTSSGEGPTLITAYADGTDKRGTATWTVTYGFVYVTFRTPQPSKDPPGFLRPFRYDEGRLSQLAATCAAETSDTAWRPYLLLFERQFQRCYTSWRNSTPVRHRITKVPQLPAGNVGLYGRWCGGGQPAGEWWGLPNHDPKDPIDALCLEHDLSSQHHDLDPTLNAAKAACIVRWGAENDRLFYEGVRVQEGSARWNAFWAAWPDMAEAKANWIAETSLLCFGNTYEEFQVERGLLSVPVPKPGPESADGGIGATDEGLQSTDTGPQGKGRGPLRLRPPQPLPMDRR